MHQPQNLKPSVVSRLKAHLSGDGTPNDATTDDLYREGHGLAADAETDLQVVEDWAFSLVNSDTGKAAEIL